MEEETEKRRLENQDIQINELNDISQILENVKCVISNRKFASDNVLLSQKTTETADHNHVRDDEEDDNVIQNELSDCNLEKETFGVDDLSLLVNEFEKLRDKYVTLEKQTQTLIQTNVSEANLKVHEVNLKVDEANSKANEANSQIDSLMGQISSLQEDNARLTQKIEELTIKEEESTSNNNAENSQEDLNEALQKTIERLEDELQKQKKLNQETAEKLTAHDAAAKRAITVLKKEMGGRLEKVTKAYEESVSEKDAYIIKIAKLEQVLDDSQQNKNSQNRKFAESKSELENLRIIINSKDSDYVKLVAANEELYKEIAKLNKKTEAHTNDVEAQDMKVKWAQNKLKAETDAHKETKKQVTQLQTKLQQAKEEGDQIRKNCQEMIERYQGDEEIKSIRLNKEVEEHMSKLKSHENKLAKQEKLNAQKDKELASLKEENNKFAQEVFDKKTQITILQGKNVTLNQELAEHVKDCAEYKTTVEDLKEKVKEMDELKDRLTECEKEMTELRESEKLLQLQVNDYDVEIGEHKDRQQEILLYSQNLTENNASSKTLVTDLQFKVDSMLTEKAEMEQKFKSREKDLNDKMEKLEGQKKKLQIKVDDLLNQLEQKSKTVNELSDNLEEAQDQLKVLKKKNVSQMKDLQRQLHQTTKKIEILESTSKNGSMENLSIRSRTSSNNSLEKIHTNDSPPNFSSSPQMMHDPVLIPQDHNIIQPNRNQFQEIEVDKKVLVERICKLQRVLAKKGEKLEFQEEHINHLTEDLQKKTKIIQFYISREEAGSLAPNRFDKNKADVSQHGGIMASVYSARPHDKGMTLELSLTINRKLQAVLEDTILKNIMLKENINTLGIEIAKLQDEVKEARTS